MAENILNQDEVNALLNAVDGGQVALEKDALSRRRVRAYDFAKPSRISKESMRVVRAIHENFAQLFSFSLSGFMRGLVNVELVSSDQLTYNEFMLSLPEYTCLNIISIAPVKGNFIIEINLNILLLFIERLLGGTSDESASIRPLTPLELSISSKIVTRLLESYRQAWSQIITFTPQVERIETDPRFAQGMGLNEMVLLLCFEVRLGKASGIINVCFPMATFEQLLPNLTYDSRIQPQKKQEEIKQRYQQALLKLPVTLYSVLDKTAISMTDILALKKGDIIRLDKSAGSGLCLYAGKKPLFEVQAGMKNNRKVVVISNRTASAPGKSPRSRST